MNVSRPSDQQDRAGGVLLGQAIGDALGVPYEFAARIEPGQAAMIGGGLGPYAPGEWSDDTQMAVCIAQVTASGADLTTDDGLRQVAERFVGWKESGATDIGNQTRAVLGAARGRADVLGAMREASAAGAKGDRAGNGALMRTGIVGLVALDDPIKTSDAAARVAGLTHAHPLCVESSVLWSEAVRVAVVDGRLDVRSGLRLLPERSRARWAGWLDEAEEAGRVASEPLAGRVASEPLAGRVASEERASVSRPPSTPFERNGFTVTALQAAWWAIHSTRHIKGPDHVEAALQAAISLGYDTDTVAAIAGALLGARYGVSGLPSDLARRVHGWPGLRGDDLVALALATAGARSNAEWVATRAHAGQVDKAGLPYIEHPRRVAALVAQVTTDEDAVAAAWLHDVVEDTSASLDELRQLGFSERVVDAVGALTRRPGEGDEYYRRVAANPIALVVKRCDIADNTDPTRVALLSSEDAARLRAKYDRALHLLAEGSGA